MENKLTKIMPEIQELIDKSELSIEDKNKIILYIEDIKSKNSTLAAMVSHMAQDISKLF